MVGWILTVLKRTSRPPHWLYVARAERPPAQCIRAIPEPLKTTGPHVLRRHGSASFTQHCGVRPTGHRAGRPALSPAGDVAGCLQCAARPPNNHNSTNTTNRMRSMDVPFSSATNFSIDSWLTSAAHRRVVFAALRQGSAQPCSPADRQVLGSFSDQLIVYLCVGNCLSRSHWPRTCFRPATTSHESAFGAVGFLRRLISILSGRRPGR